jgi:hypothetical protein
MALAQAQESSSLAQYGFWRDVDALEPCCGENGAVPIAVGKFLQSVFTLPRKSTTLWLGYW